MTNEELKAVLESLGIEFNDKPTLIYLFYERPDGTVNNLSISVNSARTRQHRRKNDQQLSKLIEQYPDTRDATLLAIDRPDEPLRQWADTAEVCQLLNTTPRTLRRWSRQGWLKPYKMGNKIYYDRREVDRLIAGRAIQENGRMDKTYFG